MTGKTQRMVCTVTANEVGREAPGSRVGKLRRHRNRKVGGCTLRVGLWPNIVS